MVLIKIEASPNMENRIEAAALVQTVHDAALSLCEAEAPSPRTWLTFAHRHKTADGDGENGFVHLTLSLKPTGSENRPKLIAEAVFQAVCRFLQKDYEQNPLAISLEVRELCKGLTFDNTEPLEP